MVNSQVFAEAGQGCIVVKEREEQAGGYGVEKKRRAEEGLKKIWTNQII